MVPIHWRKYASRTIIIRLLALTQVVYSNTYNPHRRLSQSLDTFDYIFFWNRIIICVQATPPDYPHVVELCNPYLRLFCGVGVLLSGRYTKIKHRIGFMAWWNFTIPSCNFGRWNSNKYKSSIKIWNFPEGMDLRLYQKDYWSFTSRTPRCSYGWYISVISEKAHLL